MHRCLFDAIVVLSASSSFTVALGRDQPTTQAPTKHHSLLPGVQTNGSVQLPNQWSLRPTGRQIELGDFPINLAIHPDGQWLAALHAGYGTHEIVLVDVKRQKVTSRIVLPQVFYGLCFSPDGKQLYASGGEFGVVHAYDFDNGLLAHHRQIEVAKSKDKFVTSGLAVDNTGDRLCACGLWAGAVAVVSLHEPHKYETVPIGKDSYPYACLVDPSGKQLYVSLWGHAQVAVIDLETKKVIGRWGTASHPTEMALAPGGQTLFVACSNSTRVSVIDTRTGRGLETLHCALYPNAPSGNTPNSLSLTPDGQLLFVANADANNVAVFNVASAGRAQPLGFIPVGWYPTSVRYDATNKKLYVANGKGILPFANPQGPNPLLRRNPTVRQYIGGLLRGTLSVITLPKPSGMARLTKQAYACSPLRQDAGVTAEPAADNPVPRRVGDRSPIHHVIYIIKENRTYDQIFGDMREGNGDPHLCLFPEKITPNHHRLAREFVLLDNLYCDGEVSADGHQWSMGAYATDFVEKIWPLAYRGSPTGKLSIYPSEGNYDIMTRPAGGYIWDRCKEAGVSYRSYGEW
ncbi:MAG TPA: bifunctional YncE family protein/alkaline phosphatase family protein, partial [Gemmataceae bacterium]|nr:bifunctional YncE family protein/alkaline phosphatase family protein [Gemmataceae bacterium]